MAQKVKVASAVFKRDVDTKNGKMYGYEIKLEGDSNNYSYLSKTNPQTKFVAGQEVEAELTQNDKGYWNIKPSQQAGGFGGGANSGARLELDKKLGALNAAVKLVGSGHVKIEDLKKTYDKLLAEYLN